jgi:hypothetical protein
MDENTGENHWQSFSETYVLYLDSDQSQPNQHGSGLGIFQVKWSHEIRFEII